MPQARYLTLAAPSEGSYTERRSRFLAYAYPVGDEAQVKELMAGLHRRYHDARHICYAYAIGTGAARRERGVDDGEPSGTGGKPILGQIVSAGLTDVLVAVVRYFGGIQLGAANLGRAYAAAAAEALGSATTREETLRCQVQATAPYELVDFLKRTAQDCDALVLGYDYDATGMTFRLAPPIDRADELRSRLAAKFGISLAEEPTQ